MNNPITWQQLKDFACALNEEQLNQPVFIDRIDEAVEYVSYAETVSEDVYVNKKDHDEVIELSLLAEYNSFRDEPINLDDFEIITKKGTPFLSCDVYEPIEKIEVYGEKIL